jgi:hypothetical protein
VSVLFRRNENYITRTQALFGANCIGYWPSNETSGTVAKDWGGLSQNGSFSGVSLADAAAPAVIGGSVPLYDGSAFMNFYSTSLSALFDGDAGTFMALAKVSNAGVWSDNTARYIAHIDYGSDNDVLLFKGADNVLYVRRRAGGANKTVSKAGFSGTDFFQVGITWDKVADEVIMYFNGAQEGAKQTSIASWTGVNMLSTQNIVGANTQTPSDGWLGWIAHILILNKAATATEVAKLYNWGA